MAAELRARARERIATRYGEDENMADILNKVLHDAEVATTLRNRLLHSVWMKRLAGSQSCTTGTTR
jgi:hypothetical protein